VHSTPPLTVDWDDDDGASTQGGGHYVDSVYSDTHHYGDEDPLERLSGGSDFSGDSGYSVFSGDSGYTGLSGVSGAFHNRSLLPARVKGDPRLDPTDPDYDPNEHLRRLTEGDTVDDADRFSLARGLSLGLGSLALDDGYDAISTFEGTSRSKVSRRSTSRRRDPERKRYGNIENATNAAETGDAGAIDYVHRHGMDLNAVDEDGRAALHVAAERGDCIVAERLIELGADPCIEGNLGLTPAHVAAYCGHTDVLDAVLDAGGSTNARDRDGSTPLHWACSAGKIRSVRCLLRRDDVNTGVVNGKGLTARDVSERESCTAAIIEYDATATVHNLAADGKLPIVKRLLDDAWKSNKTTEEVLESVDAAGETMLHHACRNGRVNTVESLYVEYGANPDARSGVDGATPLHLAAAGGHVECVRVYALNAGFPRRLQQRTLMRTTSVDQVASSTIEGRVRRG
jgi:ankyrin repeat protein